RGADADAGRGVGTGWHQGERDRPRLDPDPAGRGSDQLRAGRRGAPDRPHPDAAPGLARGDRAGDRVPGQRRLVLYHRPGPGGRRRHVDRHQHLTPDGHLGYPDACGGNSMLNWPADLQALTTWLPGWPDPPWQMRGTTVTAWFVPPRPLLDSVLGPLCDDTDPRRLARVRFYDVEFAGQSRNASVPAQGRFREAVVAFPARVADLIGEVSAFMW